jgi:hypothetical protein
MAGSSVCFRPRLQRGIMRTESGDELAFETNGDAEAIQGDDLVEFVFVDQGTERKARVTRVLQKAVSRCAQFEDLLHELFGNVKDGRTSVR